MLRPSMANAAPLKFLGLCGSLRKGSFNRSLLHAYGEVLPEGVTMTVFDRLGEFPLYNQDVEAQGAPEVVSAFKDAIKSADALVIASPEYNFSVPGVLKNAIDWASRPPPTTPLKNKPCGIMGASGGMSGTMRMQYHLRQSFLFTQTLVLPQPEIFVRSAAQMFDASGKLTDEPTRQILKQHAEALAAWTRKVS